MQSFKINRSDTGLFKGHQLNLVYNQEMLLPFLTHTASKEHILDQAKNRSSFDPKIRSLLAKRLSSQYEGLELSDKVMKNLELLKENNTFTITTGHQLSLYTGPLYFVIKILHVIKMAEELNKEDADNNFVPVYWMATEDHDFEEISSVEIFGKKMEWETEQNGPVGRFNTRGLEAVRVHLHSLFENSDDEIHDAIDQLEGDKYADAFRRFINHLFGEYGLLIIDGDDSELKKQFSDIIRNELKEQFSFEAISITNNEIKKNGGVLQVNPREINLFYIQDGIRSRIVKDGHQYDIDSVGQFTSDELLELLEKHPENFSPNVVLRPLYQEVILPNLAYIGGGGEIAYWLQLKRVFDSQQVEFPIIMVRNSVLWIEKNVSDKLMKFKIQLDDIFESTDGLKKEYVREQETSVLDFENIQKSKESLLKEIDELIHQVDPSLERFALGEAAKLDKQLAGIQSKLIKVSKKKHEDAMKGIDLIKDKLFPGDGLQERKLNFFQFCAKGNVFERLNTLYQVIEPFEKDLIVLREV
jgi:bacillithiol biosynthesis cysteine-adding enzyme BshC